MENRVQVKVLAKAADLPGKKQQEQEFAALAKRFQEERLQAETREAYLTLVEKQERILKEKAKELGL